MATHTLKFTVNGQKVDIQPNDKEHVHTGDTVAFQSTNSTLRVDFTSGWPFTEEQSTITIGSGETSKAYHVANATGPDPYTVKVPSGGTNAPQSSGEIDIDPDDR